MRDATTDSPSARFRRRHWTFVALLLLGAFLVAIVGNDRFPLVDRDEPLYAQASRQMVQSGDWTTPRYLDAVRLKKPVLIYWLQASSMRVLGDNAFAARLPSAIASVATLALLAIVLPRWLGHRRAFWATFVFATALLPTYLSKVGMTDAVLNLWIVVGMGCLFTIWRGHARWPTVVTLGLAIGLAALTKGPPILLYLGMTLVALWVINATIDEPVFAGAPRTIDLQRFIPSATMKVVAVVVLALLVCLPWVRTLEAKHPGAIAMMLGREVIDRGSVPQENHHGPPGYYAVTFFAMYFPWSLLWPAAVWHGWKQRATPWVRFSLAAVLGPWAFLELYQTKLPHYWLPSYPFMAILTADVLLRSQRARISDLRERPFLIATGVVGAIATLASCVLLLPPWVGGAIWPGLVSGAIVVGVVGASSVFVYRYVNEGRLLRAGATMGLTLWAVVAFVAAIYWPATPSLRMAERVGTDLRERMKAAPGEARMVEFKEPSLAFYEGGTIRPASEADFLENTPRERWPRWLVIPESGWADRPEAVRERWEERARHGGFNLAGDGIRPLKILTLENKRTPATMPAN